jgi:hypothetical protein
MIIYILYAIEILARIVYHLFLHWPWILLFLDAISFFHMCVLDHTCRSHLKMSMSSYLYNKIGTGGPGMQLLSVAACLPCVCFHPLQN